MTREEAIKILRKEIECLSHTKCEDCILEAACDPIKTTPYDSEYIEVYEMAIKALEQEPKTGRWIEIAQYSDGKHKIECSECKSHIFDRGHANSFNVKNKYKYCPNCGRKMVEPQESEDEE